MVYWAPQCLRHGLGTPPPVISISWGQNQDSETLSEVPKVTQEAELSWDRGGQAFSRVELPLS